MIEVFKTNVKNPSAARMLTEVIEKRYSTYKANFDLADCDKILRIKSSSHPIDIPQLIRLVNEFGYIAEVLPD